MHIGDGNAIRCHEGSLRIGDKVVFGKDNTVNCYLDIEIGASSLVADWVYICDFDHKTEDITLPIKDQGIVKSPVRIGPDCWLGAKVTVLRGTRVGRGCVLGAHAVVRGTSRTSRSRSAHRHGWCGIGAPTTRRRSAAGGHRGHGPQGQGGAGEVDGEPVVIESDRVYTAARSERDVPRSRASTVVLRRDSGCVPTEDVT